MTEDRFSVAGLTAVVTGSSSGIGEAIARAFAEGGADVVVCAPGTEEAALERVASEITDGDGGDALPVTCDVTDRESLPAVAEAAISEFGGLDVLVNNAGGGNTAAPVVDLSPEAWYGTVNLNLNGTYNATTTIGRRLVEGDGGSIINIASVSGFLGKPGMSPYAAAKAAIVNMTRTFAFELAGDDVRVNAIAPGLVGTERVRVRQMNGRIPAPDEIDRADVARRVGRPDEIADVARFLASPAASYVTGSTIRAQGVPRLEQRLTVSESGDGDDWA